MIEFHRYPEESEYEFIYRIGKNKDLFGSWQNVADFLNKELGHEFTESKYRKDFTTFQKMFSANKQFFINPQGSGFDFDAHEIAIKKETRKFYDQRQALNRTITKVAREEALLDCVKNAAKEMSENYPYLSDVCIKKSVDDDLPTEAVLCLADWHYGMVCHNEFNTYDTGVCKQRVADLTQRVQTKLWLHDVKVLHILLLGDFAHGAIHTSVRLESQEAVCDQIMHVSEILSEMIYELSNAGSYINVYSTYGNHLRTVQNKSESSHSDNMEKIIPWWLAERLSAIPTIEIHPATEFIRLHICGENIIAAHGDRDSVKNFPNVARALFPNTSFQYAILADKHHIEAFGSDCQTMIVPSLCGPDEYAHGKRLYSEPGQTMMIFVPEYGCDAIYNFKWKRRFLP